MQTGFLSRSAHASFQQVSIRRKQVSQDGTQVAKEATRQKQQKSRRGLWIPQLESRNTSTTTATTSDWESLTARSQRYLYSFFRQVKKLPWKSCFFFFFQGNATNGDYGTRDYWRHYVVCLGPGASKGPNYIQLGPSRPPFKPLSGLEPFGPLGRPIAKSLGTLGISWRDYGGKEMYSFSGVRTKDKVTYVCGPETRERGDEWVDMKSVCWQC